MMILRAAVFLSVMTTATISFAQASSADRMPNTPNIPSSPSAPASPTVTKMDRDITGATSQKRDCVQESTGPAGSSNTASQSMSAANPDCATNEAPR